MNGLLEILLEPSIDLSHRQLAALSLKGFIDTHWTAKSERFTGPEPSEEVIILSYRYVTRLMNIGKLWDGKKSHWMDMNEE